MFHIILTALVILATLSAIAHFSGKTSGEDAEQHAKSLTLLPGDISWQNQSGNVRVYFPVTTSIVLSVVLSLLMRLFS